jgi:hypothetical protein
MRLVGANDALHKREQASHNERMNSLCKLINTISAMIASLAFAWLAFTVTGTIPNHTPEVTVGGGLQLTSDHDGFQLSTGYRGFELSTGDGGFELSSRGTTGFAIYHQGSVQVTR